MYSVHANKGKNNSDINLTTIFSEDERANLILRIDYQSSCTHIVPRIIFLIAEKKLCLFNRVCVLYMLRSSQKQTMHSE